MESFEEIQAEAIAHYDRMINWASKQNPEGLTLIFRKAMLNDIHESWEARYCSFCIAATRNDTIDCNLCPIRQHTGYKSCVDTPYIKMSKATTWGEWLIYAEKEREFLRGLTLPYSEEFNRCAKDMSKLQQEEYTTDAVEFANMFCKKSGLPIAWNYLAMHFYKEWKLKNDVQLWIPFLGDKVFVKDIIHPSTSQIGKVEEVYEYADAESRYLIKLQGREDSIAVNISDLKPFHVDLMFSPFEDI